MSIKSVILRDLFWASDLLHGSPIRKEYKDIKKIFENKTSGCSQIKNEHLYSLLSHAVQYTNFYKGGNPNDLMSFPIVNKTILSKNYNDVCVDVRNIPGQRGDIHIQRTSGSTGTPFAVPQDTRKRNRRIAELKYFGEIVGFKSHEKLIQLRIWTKMQHKSRWQAFIENIIPFDMSNLGESRLKELCDTIKREKATCIRGYASSYDFLADYIRTHNIKLPTLKLAIAGSEALQESTRESVKKYINCDIISQYANEECGILAQEAISTGNSMFFLNQGSYVFELLKFDSDEHAEYGELGRLILTDLFNYAFPIIRYDTGDTAIMGKANNISNGYDYIQNLYGRRLDLIYDINGVPISPMILSRILKYYISILQWQFIQKTKNIYFIKIILREDNLNENQLELNLKEYLGEDAQIIFEYVDDIPVLKSGKRKSVICELNK